MKHATIVRLIILLSFPGSSLHADENLLKRVEGYYTAPARFCSDVEGDKLVSCEGEVQDCMEIKEISMRKAEINIWSTQTNGAECAVSGVASLEGRNLVYMASDLEVKVGETPGVGFSIDLSQPILRIKYINSEKKSWGAPFCGLQARLDRLEFDQKEKKKFGPSCPPE